jgi:immune inhibitor A
MAALALVAASLTAVPAVAAPKPSLPATEPSAELRHDNLPNPAAEAQAALKKEAIAKIVAGKLTPIQRNGSEVVEVSKGRWVELKKRADKVDPIFTILAQFSDVDKPGFEGDVDGPQANEIPEPDRTVDNSTYWEPNFNRDHFMKMVNGPGESMADFYYKQSGGKYSVKGDVSEWVQLPFNTTAYGSNDHGDDEVYWPFIEDTADAWYNAQIAAGKAPADITAYLKQFDVWDRYDFDEDGDFNESDGYIDHFQAIHAGEGEEAGAHPDTIWSHRWKVNPGDAGNTGPAIFKDGGTEIGDSGIWIGDYTTEPENGGLGVFTHEYGHDLGLPDLYATQGGENSTGFWSLMSSGSWLSKDPNHIGTSPGYMGPWEKLFLGWLDYTVVSDGSTKNVTLGSAATPQGLPQAVLVPLPDQTVVKDFNDPFAGSYEWWTGSGDDLNTKLTRSVDLTGVTTSASITAMVQYEIEEDYDYLYGEVTVDNGASWQKVGTNLTGSSGGAWVPVSWDLSAYKGQAIKFRFHADSDGGVNEDGAFLDNISLNTDGSVVWTDSVETLDPAWTVNGFTRLENGVYTAVAPRFYLAEYRTYTGYDKNLKTGGYNFGYRPTTPDKVDRFPVQDGLVVWYVNYAYSDNNTPQHPGGGLALPVDARPAPIVLDNGSFLTLRRSSFDAVFGFQKTDAVTFHRNGIPTLYPSQPAIPVFDDTNPEAYWSPLIPTSSVKVAGNGVRIQTLLELNGLIMVVRVKN